MTHKRRQCLGWLYFGGLPFVLLQALYMLPSLCCMELHTVPKLVYKA